MWFLIAVASASICDDIHEFDIHGEVTTITPKADGWVYFGAGFGDFGHTVNVRIYHPGGEQIHQFYYTLDHTCPTTNSSTSTSAKLFLEGATSQYAIFGVNATDAPDGLIVSVASTVRPIHPNSASMVIYALFVFFGACFLLTGFLQFHYFRKSMDPNEYRMAS